MEKMLNDSKIEALNLIINSYPDFLPSNPNIVDGDESTKYYRVLKDASFKNKIGIIDALFLLIDEELKEKMIRKKDYAVFRFAAENARLPVIEKLLEHTKDPIKKEQMIHAKDNYAFRKAATNGYLTILEKLLELTKDSPLREQMIHAKDNYAFKKAVNNGRFLVVEYLCSFIPESGTLKEILDKASLPINKIDLSFTKLFTQIRENKLDISAVKISDTIKFGTSIAGFIQIGFTKLEKFFSIECNFPKIVIEKILSYFDDKRSILNDNDRHNIYSVMEEIKEKAIARDITIDDSKSKKTNFVEKYIEQTKQNKPIRAR